MTTFVPNDCKALLVSIAFSSLLLGCSSTEQVANDDYQCQLYDGSHAPRWYCDETLPGHSDIRFTKVALESKANVSRTTQERLLLEQARLRFNQQANSQSQEVRELEERVADSAYGAESSSSSIFKSIATSESTLSQVQLYRVTLDSQGTMYGLAGMPQTAFVKAMASSQPEQ